MAPLAIAAVAAASYVIIHRAIVHKHTSASISVVQSTTTSSRTTHKASTKAKFYFVRPNDTLSRIAKNTGVSLTTLERLNPKVTPDALHPRQRLRLR